jgi:hypothetical protein
MFTLCVLSTHVVPPDEVVQVKAVGLAVPSSSVTARVADAPRAAFKDTLNPEIVAAAGNALETTVSVVLVRVPPT